MSGLTVWKTQIHADLEMIKANVERFIHHYPGNGRSWNLTFRKDDQFRDPSQSQETRKVMFDGDRRIIRESEFNVFHPKMTGTFLYGLYEKLQETGPLGRVRILRLNPGDKYSLHADHEFRFHLAIETNPESFFLVQKTRGRSLHHPKPEVLVPQLEMDEQLGIYHIPADGFLYGLNAGRRHTAMNLGSTPRTHVVFNEVNYLNDILD